MYVNVGKLCETGAALPRMEQVQAISSDPPTGYGAQVLTVSGITRAEIPEKDREVVEVTMLLQSDGTKSEHSVYLHICPWQCHDLHFEVDGVVRRT